jgi:hydrogenase/urease accessory protein HupE
MRRCAIALLATLALLCEMSADAHEMQTAYLEINAQDDGNYEVIWRGSRSRSIEPIFPDSCEVVGKVRENRTSRDEITYQWVMACEGGLGGKRLRIEGLEDTIINVLVRITRSNGGVVNLRLTPARPTGIIPSTPSFANVAQTYTFLGIEHILNGIDHLLFVLALLLIIDGVPKLLMTITSFTAAHSVTLALASLGLVNVPGPPVEAIIALSIVFVASEILRRGHRTPGLAERKPWLVAAAFGLLHGFGFAGALVEIGLPDGDIPIALFTFNVGVELGQLMFVAVALAIGWGVARFYPWPSWSKSAAAYGIGGMAAYWVIDRTSAFL